MPATILVIDDSPDSRLLMKAILKKAGHAALEAADGVEALEIMEARRPDLVLLDVNLGEGMDGFAVCAEIKARPELAATPVIFVSARDDAADKVRGLLLGGADYVAKPFDKAEVLARVGAHLELSRLNRELKEANRSLTEHQRLLEEDLTAAAQIQLSLLPDASPRFPGLACAWRFLPCQTLGGDIFNVFLLDEQHLVVYIADVSGHGVPSSLVTVSLSQALSPQGSVVTLPPDAPGGRRRPRPPASVLAEVDRLYPLERFQKTVTMVYLILNLLDGTLVYGNAGHPRPVVLDGRGGRFELEHADVLIGLGGWLPYGQASLTLRPGQRLVLCTDGVLEHASPDGELFGPERYLRALEHGPGASLGEVLDSVLEALHQHGAGRAPADDVSLLGLELGAIYANPETNVHGRRPASAS